jgi:DNA-directed RNA polymerase specialized sigma24 family protein
MRQHPPKTPKLRKKPRERRAGGFRDQLDRRWLCHVIARCGIPAADVEDLAQDVLLAAHRRSHSPPPLRPGQNAAQQRRAFLMRLARFRASRYHKELARAAVQLGDEIDKLEGNLPDGEQALEEKRRRSLATAAMTHLERTAPLAHTMVRAHDLEETPMHGMAAKMSVPLGTAWNRLRQGRLELRAFARRHEAKRPGPAEMRRLAGTKMK